MYTVREGVVTANYDGLFIHEGKWYFWDETGTESVGPFDTRQAAEVGIVEYAKQLNEVRGMKIVESKVFEENGQWYFTDNCPKQGPYATEVEATAALDKRVEDGNEADDAADNEPANVN